MRRHIILKVIILPRQARDKHRESSAQKQTCDFCFLSAGGEIVVKHELMTICIDEWIEFRSPGKVAVLIKQLRAVSHERERERDDTTTIWLLPQCSWVYPDNRVSERLPCVPMPWMIVC